MVFILVISIIFSHVSVRASFVFQIPIFVDCSGRRLSGSELPPWSISYPANVNGDHVIVDFDLSGRERHKWGQMCEQKVGHSRVFADNKITSVDVFPPLPVQSISFRNNKITRIADR